MIFDTLMQHFNIQAFLQVSHNFTCILNFLNSLLFDSLKKKIDWAAI